MTILEVIGVALSMILVAVFIVFWVYKGIEYIEWMPSDDEKDE